MRGRSCGFLLGWGMALAAGGAAAVAQQNQVFTTIDVPGATGTVALDINAAGDIVGSYVEAGRTRGYLLDRSGQFHLIDVPGAVFTRVAGISARGDIVGTYRLFTEQAGARHGFLWSAGQFTTIDPPGAVFTNPLGINEWGDIVGRFCLTTPCQPESAAVHGFLWSEGAFTTIDVPGAMGTNAWKISARGDILGGYTDAGGRKRVFQLGGRGFVTIDVPGVVETANDNGGVNPQRDIVGVYCDTAPCRGASLDAHGFVLTKGVLTTIDVPGAITTNAFGINERGDIVGLYEDGTGFHGFVLARGE
jgi:uncharacterized membrane protein